MAQMNPEHNGPIYKKAAILLCAASMVLALAVLVRRALQPASDGVPDVPEPKAALREGDAENLEEVREVEELRSPASAVSVVVSERFSDESPKVAGAVAKSPFGLSLPHGRWVQRYSDGSVEVEWWIFFGVEFGPWRAWYETGQQHIESFYQAGRPHGPYQEWYPDGQLAAEGAYDWGLEADDWRRWYPNGQQESVGTFDRGVRVGKWTFWHNNGQRSAEGMYDEGREVGDWRYWERNGETIETQEETNSRVAEGLRKQLREAIQEKK